ncbi:MAG: DHHA1 domain-containing protein [Pseudomonadota bacterium]
MIHYDCFNGDADGICALTQLRRNFSVISELVTGVKRDISLLERIVDKVKEGDVVTVLDVSMDKNRQALEKILKKGASVFYCDHHFVGEMPDAPNLVSLVNFSPDVSTSLLINQHLNSAYVAWAIVGTFGDNLDKSATGMAKKLSLREAELERLKNLGVYLNYNGYGSSLSDLYFDPAELFARTRQFDDPFQFMAEDKDTFSTLEQGYHDDMKNARESKPEVTSGSIAMYILPDQTWSRRVSGVFGNALANQHPDRAHAVVTHKDEDHYVVSVRAPKNRKAGADEVCRQFDTGGGRAAAAGVNALPKSELERFVKVLQEQYEQAPN